MRSLWCTLAILLCVCTGYWTFPISEDNSTAGCGYQSCPVGLPGKLNVHLVAHTHDDVGWLKTVDQYYYGGRNNIQKAGVQYIIDSVIAELLEDVSKRFIYVETSFLWKWWQEQDETMRTHVRSLVNSGRLEIIGGAWSMNDEAVTNYQSIIDQFTWGFRILNDTLGACAAPRVGWQIDPFGHSREMASIFAQLGMDGLFFGRLDEQDKVARLRDKTMEMVWQASPDNLGSSSDLFTHAMYNFYFSPPGFCFDIMCNDDPMIDNIHSPGYNIPARVEEFVRFVRGQATGYKTNNLIVTMGGDFHYQDAHVWFKNLDKLIKYTNALQANGSDINLFYSTPSCYLKAVNEADETWPTKRDDFFPYGSEDHSYWTGYFTSKPTIKFFERLGNNFLQVSKQLTALAGLTLEATPGVTELREAMGIMQHHDAITGTMKDHVAQDYSRILSEAIDESGKHVQTAVNSLMHKEGSLNVSVTSCLQLNNSVCVQSEGSTNFLVTVHNPLSWPVSHYVRLPVNHCCYSVTDPAGNILPTQTVALPDWVTHLPGRESTAANELVFRAVDIPPVGFRSFYVAREESAEGRITKPIPFDLGKAESISNKLITLSLSANGATQAVSMNGVEMPLVQTFGYYKGYFKEGDRSSGAYIFRPNGTDAVEIKLNQTWIVKGDLVEEVHQLFEDGWVAHVIRLYGEEDHVEFEWQVGPIPSGDSIGKEVISRYDTNLTSSDLFYTDSNGRETITRVRDFRPTWPLNLTEPVASNFYPVTSKIAIMDEVTGRRAAILVDRAQSGSSLKDGQVELMLHRRLFHDDGYGVNEPLNELAYGSGLVARGKHYVTVGATSGLSPTLIARERLIAQRKLVQPWTFLTPAGGLSGEEWAAAYNMEFSGLAQALPGNIHLLTLEPWGDASFLVRVEHFLERGEDPELSEPAVINLQDMFSQFTVVSAQEMSLGGNHLLQEQNRLRWRSEDDHKVRREVHTGVVDLTAVALDPMQIRTFVVQVSPQ